MSWKGFNLKRGYVFGADENGLLYVCLCVRPPSSDPAAPLMVWRANDNNTVVCRQHDTIYGAYSRMIGKRPVVMEHGKYASEWGLRWYPSSIPVDCALGRRIIALKRMNPSCKKEKYCDQHVAQAFANGFQPSMVIGNQSLSKFVPASQHEKVLEKNRQYREMLEGFRQREMDTVIAL